MSELWSTEVWGCGRRKEWCVWNSTVADDIWINLHITCGEDRKQLQHHNQFFLEWHCTKFQNSEKQMMVNSLWQHENTQLFTKVYKDTKFEGIKEALCVILLPYRLRNNSQVALLRKLGEKNLTFIVISINLCFFIRTGFTRFAEQKDMTVCMCVLRNTVTEHTRYYSLHYLKLTKGWYRGKKEGGKWSHQWLSPHLNSINSLVLYNLYSEHTHKCIIPVRYPIICLSKLLNCCLYLSLEACGTAQSLGTAFMGDITDGVEEPELKNNTPNVYVCTDNSPFPLIPTQLDSTQFLKFYFSDI